MIKTFFAAAAFAGFATSAIAAEAPKQSFQYQGVTYVYTAEVKDGVKTLRGTTANGKVPFELKVTKAGVTGTFDRTPVTFDLHEVEHIDSKDVVSGQ